jgi:hypothetical protein
VKTVLNLRVPSKQEYHHELNTNFQIQVGLLSTNKKLKVYIDSGFWGPDCLKLPKQRKIGKRLGSWNVRSLKFFENSKSKAVPLNHGDAKGERKYRSYSFLT